MNTRRWGVVTVLALSGLASTAGSVDARADRPEAAATTDPTAGWTVERDAFADLWFHGLAVVGFDGFGTIPLYDPGYGWAATAHRARLSGPTPLEQARGRILASFAADPSYEVLHFVPLYLAGMPEGAALDMLRRLGVENGDHARGGSAGSHLHRTGSALAAALPSHRHQEVLRDFAALLASERRVLDEFELAAIDLGAVRNAWSELAAGVLGSFLAEEQLTDGRIIVTPALGMEGRYLDSGSGRVVAIGATSESDPRAVAGAVLRELCYPVVRRVVAPYERRIGDRERLSTMSHHVATRCGARLLRAHAPDYLPAYQTRFGSSASDAGFLSVPGLGPDTATLMREMDRALTRALNLDGDESWASPWLVRR